MKRPEVFIISPCPATVQIVSDSLNERRISIHVARSAVEGLKLMRTNFYRIVVADILFDGTEDIELIARLKQISPLAQVFVLTRIVSPELMIDCVERGASDCFSKMDDPLQLAAEIVHSQQRAERWLKSFDFNGVRRISAPIAV